MIAVHTNLTGEDLKNGKSFFHPLMVLLISLPQEHEIGSLSDLCGYVAGNLWGRYWRL